MTIGETVVATKPHSLNLHTRRSCTTNATSPRTTRHQWRQRLRSYREGVSDGRFSGLVCRPRDRCPMAILGWATVDTVRLADRGSCETAGALVLVGRLSE